MRPFALAGDYPAPEGPDSDIVDDVPVAECAVAHDGRFNQGSRAGYIRRIDYPADWPVADVVVRWIEDRCFAPVHAAGAVHRDRSCPQGQTGQVTERAVISWYNRTWADRAHNATGDTRTAAQALAAWSEDDDQTALEWYDRVSAGDWSVARNTCQQAPVMGGGGDGGGGGDWRTTWDVDGDGHGDFATQDEAEAYMYEMYLYERDPYATGPDYGEIEEATHNCGRCDGPDHDPLRPWLDTGPDDHNGGGNGLGGFFTSVGEFFSSIFGGGNNNDNDDNDNQDDDEDDGEDDDSGGGFFDRLFGRAT